MFGLRPNTQATIYARSLTFKRTEMVGLGRTAKGVGLFYVSGGLRCRSGQIFLLANISTEG
jgi:hypothetical protein